MKIKLVVEYIADGEEIVFRQELIEFLAKNGWVVLVEKEIGGSLTYFIEK